MTLKSPAASKVVTLVGEALRLLDSIPVTSSGVHADQYMSPASSSLSTAGNVEDARAYLRSALQGLGRRHRMTASPASARGMEGERAAFQDLIQRSDVALQQSARWRREVAMRYAKMRAKNGEGDDDEDDEEGGGEEWEGLSEASPVSLLSGGALGTINEGGTDGSAIPGGTTVEGVVESISAITGASSSASSSSSSSSEPRERQWRLIPHTEVNTLTETQHFHLVSASGSFLYVDNSGYLRCDPLAASLNRSNALAVSSNHDGRVAGHSPSARKGFGVLLSEGGGVGGGKLTLSSCPALGLGYRRAMAFTMSRHEYVDDRGWHSEVTLRTTQEGATHVSLFGNWFGPSRIGVFSKDEDRSGPDERFEIVAVPPAGGGEAYSERGHRLWYALRHVKSNRYVKRRSDGSLGLAPEGADLHVEAARAEAAAADAAAGADGLLGRSLSPSAAASSNSGVATSTGDGVQSPTQLAMGIAGAAAAAVANAVNQAGLGSPTNAAAASFMGGAAGAENRARESTASGGASQPQPSNRELAPPTTTMPLRDDGEILMLKIHALEEIDSYDVVFWEQRLGLRVTKTLPLTVIGFTAPPRNQLPAFEAEAKGTVMIGDTVASIDGRSIKGMTRNEVFQLLNNLKRPVIMGMCSWRVAKSRMGLSYLRNQRMRKRSTATPNSALRFMRGRMRGIMGSSPQKTPSSSGLNAVGRHGSANRSNQGGSGSRDGMRGGGGGNGRKHGGKDMGWEEEGLRLNVKGKERSRDVTPPSQSSESARAAEERNDGNNAAEPNRVTSDGGRERAGTRDGEREGAREDEREGGSERNVMEEGDHHEEAEAEEEEGEEVVLVDEDAGQRAVMEARRQRLNF